MEWGWKRERRGKMGKRRDNARGDGRGKEGRKEGRMKGVYRGEWRGCQFRVAQRSTICLPTCEDFLFAIQYRGCILRKRNRGCATTKLTTILPRE